MDKHQIPGSDTVAAKNLNQNVSEVTLIFNELELNADIKERDLVYFLDVADKTLRNWKSSNLDTQAGKMLRLHRLKEVVDSAVRNSISKSQIRQLLIAPLDLRDKNQRSIVDVIRTEPESQFFSQMVSMLIENFRSRTASNGHFVINEEDFDEIAKDLAVDREPSDAVKKARAKFVELRKKA